MKMFRSEVADDFTSYARMNVDVNDILRENNIQNIDGR